MLDILKFIIILISPIWVSVLVIIFMCVFFFILSYRKGMRVDVSKSTYKRDSLFKRLFYMFPKQIIADLFNKKADSFNEYGLHMFCGEQGSGKTTSVVETLIRWKKIYPKLKIRTNMNYIHEDGAITHWKTLIENDNGVYGQVEVLDEIQAWFSSNQSKNFPPEMLAEISQQRKQRKCLIGTAQVFSRIAKPIREQTTFVYLPVTIMGCLTIVRVSKPEFWSDEKMVFTKYVKNYFFVHNPEIRNSFDTFKKIKQYKKNGFQSNSILRKAE